MNGQDPGTEPVRTAGGQYEFSAAQNQTIGTLARSMRVVGAFLILMGVVELLGAVLQLVRTGTFQINLAWLLYFIFGAWTRKAARSFQLIVDTQGSDISHLMSALDNLRKIYGFLYWFILVVLILMLILGIVLALLYPTTAPTFTR
jgi:hypothetical protein